MLEIIGGRFLVISLKCTYQRYQIYVSVTIDIPTISGQQFNHQSRMASLQSQQPDSIQRVLINKYHIRTRRASGNRHDVNAIRSTAFLTTNIDINAKEFRTLLSQTLYDVRWPLRATKQLTPRGPVQSVQSDR